jgi:hypothetical protein
MAYNLRHPQYYILPVELPQPPLHCIEDLSERTAVLASTEYPTTVSATATTKILRQKFTKLLQVRDGTVDVDYIDVIGGTIQDNDRAALWKDISRWITNTQGTRTIVARSY